MLLLHVRRGRHRRRRGGRARGRVVPATVVLTLLLEVRLVRGQGLEVEHIDVHRCLGGAAALIMLLLLLAVVLLLWRRLHVMVVVVWVRVVAQWRASSVRGRRVVHRGRRGQAVDDDDGIEGFSFSCPFSFFFFSFSLFPFFFFLPSPEAASLVVVSLV